MFFLRIRRIYQTCVLYNFIQFFEYVNNARLLQNYSFVVQQAHHERGKVNDSKPTTVHSELVEGNFRLLQETQISTI